MNAIEMWFKNCYEEIIYMTEFKSFSIGLHGPDPAHGPYVGHPCCT